MTNKLSYKLIAVLVTFLFTISSLIPGLAFAQGRRGNLGALKEGTNSSGAANDSFMRGRAAVGTGILSAINGTTLTVTKDGKSYTVLTDTNTQFRRRFWGKSSLSEMSVEDTVNIIGRWTDAAKTTIQARLVRDLSIQKRNGVFFGTVQSLTSTGWVMTTIRRGNQTVTVSSTTKFINRRGQTISRSDIAVGNRVRVRGLWDRTKNTITEASEVKDFSLPAQAGSPVPTK